MVLFFPFSIILRNFLINELTEVKLSPFKGNKTEQIADYRWFVDTAKIIKIVHRGVGTWHKE